MSSSPTTVTIPWNRVSPNLPGHALLRKKIRQKLGKLAHRARVVPVQKLESLSHRRGYDARARQELSLHPLRFKACAAECELVKPARRLPDDTAGIEGCGTESLLDLIEHRLQPRVIPARGQPATCASGPKYRTPWPRR